MEEIRGTKHNHLNTASFLLSLTSLFCKNETRPSSFHASHHLAPHEQTYHFG